MIIRICRELPLFNFERLGELCPRIGHPVKSYDHSNLLRASVFHFERLDIFTGLNQTSDKKGYCRLNLLKASVFHFERLDILQDSIRHPSKKLLSFEFGQSFNIQYRAFRYITGFNQTSE